MPTPQKPRSRTISAKGLVIAVSGKEQPYPVYDRSKVGKRPRYFYERPKHNPFAGL